MPGDPPSLPIAPTRPLLCPPGLWSLGVEGPQRQAPMGPKPWRWHGLAEVTRESGAEQSKQPGLLGLRGQVLSPRFLAVIFEELQFLLDINGQESDQEENEHVT